MRGAITVLILVVVLHFCANFFGVYDIQIESGVVWVDNILHALVGISMAMFCSSIYRAKTTPLILGFVIATALIWEFIEFGFFILAPIQALELKVYSPSLSEASIDIISNLAGALIFLTFHALHK